MFTVPVSGVSRRGQTIYGGGSTAMCFFLMDNGIQDGSLILSPPCSNRLYLEISLDLIPAGTSMADAKQILSNYLAGQDITSDDIDLFKMVYPDWAAGLVYTPVAAMNYDMVAYNVINPLTSVEGVIPPDYPELYSKPFA